MEYSLVSVGKKLWGPSLANLSVAPRVWSYNDIYVVHTIMDLKY